MKTYDFENLISKNDECNVHMALEFINNYTFTSPHYNSVVDLDGDCKSDLVIIKIIILRYLRPKKRIVMLLLSSFGFIIRGNIA